MRYKSSEITSEIAKLNEAATQRKREINSLVPHAQQILHEHADDSSLIDLAQHATETMKWRGAIPIGEKLDAVIDPPHILPQVTIIAADSSQRFPNYHDPVLYYVINIETTTYRQGTGQEPTVITESKVHGADRLLGVNFVSGDLINVRRRLLTLAKVADLAISEDKSELAIALINGSLAISARSEFIPHDEQEQIERDYFQWLDNLRVAKLAVGGIVLRPRSSMIVALAQLASFDDPLKAFSDAINDRVPPFEGMTDLDVFSPLLRPGQRTAVFEAAPGWNTTYRARGHSIHFFYINVNYGLNPELIRVEIPAWVAQNQQMLRSVHAAIAQQWRVAPIYLSTQKADHAAPLIVTEGKTDWKHLKAAYQKLRAQGRYNGVDVEFLEYENPRGDEALLTMCASYSEANHGRPFIFVFDRDNPSIVKKASGDGIYKSWPNSVFSFAIPVPDHRHDSSDICIELFYSDSDLKRKNRHGRRLFLSNEFNQKSGRHKDQNLNCTDLNKIRRSIIVDDQVYDENNVNVALSKSDFADCVLNQDSGFESVDVSEFQKIFDIIDAIIQYN